MLVPQGDALNILPSIAPLSPPTVNVFKFSGFYVFFKYILTRDPLLETGVTFKLALYFGQLMVSNF